MRVLLICMILFMGVNRMAFAEPPLMHVPPGDQNFILFHSNMMASYYLDTARIILFSKSKLRDGWVKTAFVEANGSSRAIEKTRTSKKLNKEEIKENKDVAYLLAHEQLDPINFKFKVLEIDSYNQMGMMVARNIKDTPWMDILPDSMEEKMLKSINEFINNQTDKVIIY